MEPTSPEMNEELRLCRERVAALESDGDLRTNWELMRDVVDVQEPPMQWKLVRDEVTWLSDRVQFLGQQVERVLNPGGCLKELGDSLRNLESRVDQELQDHSKQIAKLQQQIQASELDVSARLQKLETQTVTTGRGSSVIIGRGSSVGTFLDSSACLTRGLSGGSSLVVSGGARTPPSEAAATYSSLMAINPCPCPHSSPPAAVRQAGTVADGTSSARTPANNVGVVVPSLAALSDKIRSIAPTNPLERRLGFHGFEGDACRGTTCVSARSSSPVREVTKIAASSGVPRGSVAPPRSARSASPELARPSRLDVAFGMPSSRRPVPPLVLRRCSTAASSQSGARSHHGIGVMHANTVMTGQSPHRTNFSLSRSPSPLRFPDQQRWTANVVAPVLAAQYTPRAAATAVPAPLSSRGLPFASSGCEPTPPSQNLLRSSSLEKARLVAGTSPRAASETSQLQTPTVSAQPSMAPPWSQGVPTPAGRTVSPPRSLSPTGPTSGLARLRAAPAPQIVSAAAPRIADAVASAVACLGSAPISLKLAPQGKQVTAETDSGKSRDVVPEHRRFRTPADLHKNQTSPRAEGG